MKSGSKPNGQQLADMLSYTRLAGKGMDYGVFAPGLAGDIARNQMQTNINQLPGILATEVAAGQQVDVLRKTMAAIDTMSDNYAGRANVMKLEGQFTNDAKELEMA